MNPAPFDLTAVQSLARDGVETLFAGLMGVGCVLAVVYGVYYLWTGWLRGKTAGRTIVFRPLSREQMGTTKWGGR